MTTRAMSVNLTKKILIAAPEGAYLVSNCFKGFTRSSIFEETVSLPEEREHQWERVLAAHANHRLCRVFATKQDCLAWLQEVLSLPVEE